MAQRSNRYIVYLESSDAPIEKVWDELGSFDIKPDREYGILPLNQDRNQWATRVWATEAALKLAQQKLPLSFFPDLGVSVDEETG